MIHYIKGRITETTDTGVVIERNGIGYELTVPSLSAVYMAPPDQEVTVYTAMIVREDDVSLYGFDDRESLKLFRLLMTVSGIGAKAAVAVLSALSPAEVQEGCRVQRSGYAGESAGNRKEDGAEDCTGTEG